MKPLTSYRNVKSIKAVFLDFDGVFTDNSVFVDEHGSEHVKCSRYDGFGISTLIKNDFIVEVISTEKVPLAVKRCKKLNIPCTCGVKNKLQHALSLCNSYQISLSEVCYFGNDVNDLELLKSVAFPVVTPDSHRSVHSEFFYTTTLPGGKGCIRELSDFLINP